MTTFSERDVKAIRKAVPCDGCGKVVPVGAPATRWAGLCDGEFASVAYHPDCRQAEIALNERCGTWGDEWQPIASIEPEDRNWLLTEFPAVAERLGIKVAGVPA
jgi:hypothetical protein